MEDLLRYPKTRSTTSSAQFNDMVNVIFSSPAMVGATVAFFLDTTIMRGDKDAKRDRWWHWWKKFRCFSGDSRWGIKIINMEIYPDGEFTILGLNFTEFYFWDYWRLLFRLESLVRKFRRKYSLSLNWLRAPHTE